MDLRALPLTRRSAKGPFLDETQHSRRPDRVGSVGGRLRLPRKTLARKAEPTTLAIRHPDRPRLLVPYSSGDQGDHPRRRLCAVRRRGIWLWQADGSAMA